MNERAVILGAAVMLVLAAMVTMAGLHESHYRARRATVLGARLQGLELRLAALEAIATEDRLT